jgi:hypothetical protein
MEIRYPEIIAAIISGVFLIIAKLIPLFFRREHSTTETPVENGKGEKEEKEKSADLVPVILKREPSIPETPAEDGKGEKKGKKLRISQKISIGIGVIFFGLALILWLTRPRPDTQSTETATPPVVTMTNPEEIVTKPEGTVTKPAETASKPAETVSAEDLLFYGWYVWRGSAITASVSGNMVTLNGRSAMTGFVTEGLNAAAMRGKTVTLEIRNAGDSVFDDGRMIKITVNKNDLTVQPDNIPNLIEKEYVPETATRVVFKLPDDFDGKIGFGFYNADLRNLQITATYE